MSLAAGDRLGPYEVLSELGAGGMGEVYRARDATLKRDVALKILPDGFALDQERLARFKREAQVLASLNHSNIAAIYGFEESNGLQALVLELVEGPTLADRIGLGPIPINEAVPIARQIAEALEAAHEQGIVHRDLKPANVKLRPDGTVKVLDFGLAKSLEPAVGRSGDAAASPTITSPYYRGTGPYTARTYDVSHDGKQFLMIKPVTGNDGGPTLASLVVVQNWLEELTRLVPLSEMTGVTTLI